MWASRIREALDSDQFEFFAQPIVPASPDSPARPHLELLLRMRRPDGGHVANSTMISAVEEFHYGLRVDTWVIENAFRLLADYRVGGDSPTASASTCPGSRWPRVRSSTTCSTAFATTESPRTGLFRGYGDRGHRQHGNGRPVLQGHAQLGCRLALDDFGSGLSSYGYLRQIPADIVKIDGSLISGLADDDIKLAIVDSIINLASRLDKTTIAEHVESERVKDILLDLGVDMLQGNFVSQPVPVRRFLETN
ncbi:MAG: EAL domain-containing protein [Gammaproteobacteria bacterium]|nr:EAL domain-containing protein [Gammaproteobacteria bacterium]